MKLFKVLSLSLTLVIVMFSLSLNAFAQSPQSVTTTSPRIEKTVTDQKPISSIQLDNLKRNSIRVTPTTKITPFDTTGFTPLVQLYYSFTDLYPGHYIDTIHTFNVSSPSTVSLTLVQYPNAGPTAPGTVDLYYQLIGTLANSSILEVNGDYTSTNTTISWNNVPTGTYYIEITSDMNSPDAQGNGYIN